MNLAITLLVVIAIAAVIGTVLQQNEAYTDYVRKFGPFWFEVFKNLGLFDIYGAPWFLALLGFLLSSTSVCVWRNAPHILQDMRQFRVDVQEKSLRGFHLKAEWDSARSSEQASKTAAALLAARGYRVRVRDHGDHTVVAAMKGSAGRLGYILSHLAIVVICIGGLIDGNLPLKLREMEGKLKIETRDIPVAEVPAVSTLGTDNLSFRGSVTIPEGGRAGFVYLQLRDGYLIQKLPFAVALDDFRIEHYPSGMPKSFESDIVIFDDQLKEPLHKTIKVNHPLLYRGYAIYQASFADGGSHLKMRAWSLDTPDQTPVELSSGVNRFLRLKTSRGERTLEFSDFKLYNIFPEDDPKKAGKPFRNYGPSFVFKVRNPAGEALEYANYMSPVEIEGRLFFMSGMRSTPSDPYRYLYIPADADMSPKRFMQFLAAARDEALVRKVIASQVQETVSGSSAQDKALRATMADSILRLEQLFINDGIDGVLSHAKESIPADKRQEAINSYVKVLQGILGGVYIDVLRQDGVDLSKGVSDSDSSFFDDSMNAFSLLGPYGSPFYLQLVDFKQVEASGLQITRAPGKDVVYLGCAMLTLGVFMMFYLHHRRVWVWVGGKGGGSAVLFAGSGHRVRSEFEREFRALQAELAQAVPPADVS